MQDSFDKIFVKLEKTCGGTWGTGFHRRCRFGRVHALRLTSRKPQSAVQLSHFQVNSNRLFRNQPSPVAHPPLLTTEVAKLLTPCERTSDSQEFSDFVTTEKTSHGEITLFWRWDDVNTALKRGVPGTAARVCDVESQVCQVSTEMVTAGYFLSNSPNKTRVLGN